MLEILSLQLKENDELKRRVDELMTMFTSNVQWQEKKTQIQEETVGFILETIQNLTDRIVKPDSPAEPTLASEDVSVPAFENFGADTLEKPLEIDPFFDFPEPMLEKPTAIVNQKRSSPKMNQVTFSAG